MAASFRSEPTMGAARMSVVFSLSIPFSELPAPSVFIESLAPKWQPDYSESPNVVRLATMGNTVLPICPTADELGWEKWVEDRSYMFYLSNVSTRGLEVWYVDKTFKVRIMSLSCAEEWEFAFQILELAAGGENATITTDWQPPTVRLHAIRDAFSQFQIFEAQTRQLRAAFDAVMTNEECAVIDGPINKFHLGPWLCNRILTELNTSDEAEILEFVFALMRMVNYFGVMPQFDGIDAPRIEPFPLKGKTGVVALIHGEQMFFVPEVDALILMDSHDGSVAMRKEYFKEHLLQYFTEVDELVWLDEYQFVVQRIPSVRFEQIMRLIATNFKEDGHPRKAGVFNLFKQ